MYRKIRGGYAPFCSTCGQGTISVAELSHKWGVSKNTIDYHGRKNGLPSHDGIYPNGDTDVNANRQGTHGITEKFYCEDEADMWAMVEGVRHLRRRPKSWVKVPALSGLRWEYRPQLNRDDHVRTRINKFYNPAPILINLSKQADPNLNNKLPW